MPQRKFDGSSSATSEMFDGRFFTIYFINPSINPSTKKKISLSLHCLFVCLTFYLQIRNFIQAVQSNLTVSEGYNLPTETFKVNILCSDLKLGRKQKTNFVSVFQEREQSPGWETRTRKPELAIRGNPGRKGEFSKQTNKQTTDKAGV